MHSLTTPCRKKMTFFMHLFFLLIPLFGCNQVHGQVISTFDTDTDGWTLINDGDNDTIPLIHNAAGGNPGGHISGNTPTDNYPGYFWYAPAKFLGNLAYKSLGQTLTFSLQQLVTGNNGEFNGNYYEAFHADVFITNGNTTLYFHTSPKPTLIPDWSTYSVTLDETSAWRTTANATGPLATRAQIMSILRNVTQLGIRANYNLTANTVALDEVSLGQLPVIPPPVVTSFSPLSGASGSSITINGNGFDPIASNNVVQFGHKKGTVTSASATQLVVTVPVGITYGRITITNTVTGRSQTSHNAFNPTFEGGGRIIHASFGNRVDIPIPYGPKGFNIIDVDGDGWTDIAIASNSTDLVDIYRNLGQGGEITNASFSNVSIAMPGNGTNGTGLAFADLDGDGLPDAVSSSSLGSASFVTFRNISTPGNIAFEAPEYWPGGSDETPITHIADLDGDGRPELMAGEGSISNSTFNYFWVNHNLSTPGNIQFNSGQSFVNGTVINGFASAKSGDLDGDGKPELIVSATQGQSMVILHNTSSPGSLSFEHSFSVATGQYISNIVIADINLDGKNDILWKKQGGQTFFWLNSDTDGILTAEDFSTEITITGDVGSYGGMSIIDFNGDNKPDIAVTDAADIGIYESVYDGGVFDSNAFIKSYQIPGGGANTYPSSATAADLNNDNKPDLIMVTTNQSLRISIFENKNRHTPVISINTVSPLKGAIGSTVTITGSHFSSTPSENKVWFGGVQANVLSSTPNEIQVEVPEGAGYERVSVTVGTLTSFYHLPFNITFGSGTTFDNTSFLPPITYPLTGADYDVEVADMNADGKPEVVAESRIVTGIIRNYGLSYRNDHTGGTITATSFALDDTTATSARNLKILDVDSDELPDILAAEGIYRNTSTATEISYDANVTLAANSFNHTWADFNQDGKIDIATTHAGGIFVFENRSPRPEPLVTGTYATIANGITITKPAGDGGLVAGDFDGDGLPEFASTNPTTDNMRVWRNTGAHRIVATQFAVVGDLPTGDNPGRLYIGDLDSDGKMDLLLYHGTGTSTTLLIVFHNQSTLGNIAFNRVDFTLPAAATVAHISDLDGDGRPEILATSESTDQFFILKNVSTPGVINSSSFAAPFASPVTNPRGITTGDLNADGKPEIIITSAPNSLLIFENNIAIGPVITITTAPASTNACEGTPATLTVAATGTTNITYRWQLFNGTTFNDITDGGGYSGASTTTLTITTTAGFEAGDYRCRVSGDLATEVFTTTATVTVNPLPSPPSVTSDTECVSPATLTLTATGAADGNFNWYDVSTGGSALGTNGSFTTPSITTTTTYYVSLEDAFCESARVPVDAIISLLVKPTLGASEPIASGRIDICDGETCTLTAPAGFAVYTWSNGATTQQISVNTPGMYSVVVEDAGGCVSPTSDPVDVAVNPFPDANITVNGTQLTASSGDSYQWFVNDVPAGGATAQTFEYSTLEFGVYTVDVTENGCTTRSDDFVYLITGSETSIQRSIYPNPFSDYLHIEVPTEAQFQLTDGVGRRVMEARLVPGQINSLDVRTLKPGMYVLSVQYTNHVERVKLEKH